MAPAISFDLRTGKNDNYDGSLSNTYRQQPLHHRPPLRIGLRVSDFQLDMSYTMPMARRYTVRNEFKATLSFNLNN